MVVKHRLRLLLSGTMLGASFLIAAPAFAQDAKTEQMQNQINALQQQLQVMQAQVSQTKKDAKAAEQAVQNLPSNLYNAAPPGSSPVVTKGPPSWFDSIHVSMAGSFVALEGAWRQRNEIASGASDLPFGSLPYQNSPLFYENEFGFSAQQSRIALKANGDIDPSQHLKAYYEMDFLGAATTSNSRESNSYTPRIRQAFFEYDNDNYHFHMSAGQQWSLVTQEKVGMLPQNENTPLTIDAQYVAGFNWARQPSIRFVEDWNKVAWFGFSVENPETAFVSNGAGVGMTPNTALVVPPGLGVNPGNTCSNSGLLDNQTMCGNNIAPDLVEKVALDPGWGHYEALALQRWFSDEVSTLATPNSWGQKVSFGWGFGGSVLLPVVPKWLDLQGSVLTGQGIGRYASSQLADVTIGSNGALSPLQATQFLVGAVAHVVEGNDIYAYYGQEQMSGNAWTVAGVNGGYGNPGYAMSGCATQVLTSTTAAGLNASTATCTANVQKTQEFTIGFWQDVYKGNLGRARVGLQYEYVTLTAFPGTGSAAGGLNPNNNIVFLSLRYYPFN